MTKTFFAPMILLAALGYSQPALAACGDDEPIITMHFLVGASSNQNDTSVGANLLPAQRPVTFVAEGDECEDARVDTPQLCRALRGCNAWRGEPASTYGTSRHGLNMQSTGNRIARCL